MLWDQHRDRFEAAGMTARRITYCKFKELTAHITAEDMAAIGRLNAKRQAGATLDPEETERLTEIASRWPIDDLRGACLIPPRSGQETRDLLDGMARRDAELLASILDQCATPEIPKEDAEDPLAIALVLRGALGIDVADMTVGQGYAIMAMLTPREG